MTRFRPSDQTVEQSVARLYNSSMQLILCLLLVSVSLFAQQPGGRGGAPQPAPKNLKLMAPNSDIPFIMRNFNEALGVQCTYCHVEGDFAADTNPKKEIEQAFDGLKG